MVDKIVVKIPSFEAVVKKHPDELLDRDDLYIVSSLACLANHSHFAELYLDC